MKRFLCPALALALSLSACNPPAPGDLEVALSGLEPTTYVSGSLTFKVAVVGGTPDSLELRRGGQLFQVLSGNSFTWETASIAEGSYTFVARARKANKTFDSPPKLVVVDHTPPALTLSATPSATPLIVPGSVALAATASDANGVTKVEFFDGASKIGEASAPPYTLGVSLGVADHAVHAYTARALDRAANETRTPAQTVPAYLRQTMTLPSEAALDGCVEVGYNQATHQRKFSSPSCTFTTSYTIAHFFSFDRSAYPAGTVVEKATLRFNLSDVSAYPGAKLASVSYARTEDAPPTQMVYPYVSSEPETDVSLTAGAAGLANQQRLDVSALVQADAQAGRPRSQLRLRSLNNGPGGLGGTLYFTKAGSAQAPTLELQLLVP